MLGGDDYIFHTCLLRHSCPIFWIKEIGVEIIEILLILFVGQPFMVLHPFVTGRQGIETPVNEHSETGISPPLHTLHLLSISFLGKLGIKRV